MKAPGKSDQDGELPLIPTRAFRGHPATLDIAPEPHTDLRAGVYRWKLRMGLARARGLGAFGCPGGRQQGKDRNQRANEKK